MNKKLLVMIVLWSCLLLWMGLIFSLSSQNGIETANTSSGLAKEVAQVVYEKPTKVQVDYVHMWIRKSAHFVLFFTLGIIGLLCMAVTVRSYASWWIVSVLSAITLTSACGFFDEWHKQFIVGRHFDYGETVLNIVSGISGVIIMTVVCGVIKKKRRT